jgi:branched-subunit amino acid transport protein
MSVASGLVIVLGVAFATYAMRAGLILALADRSLPPVVERALRNVGPAVLAALTMSLAFGSSEGGSATFEVPEVAALVAAGAVAYWRRNMIMTLVVGMVTLWVLSAIV